MMTIYEQCLIFKSWGQNDPNYYRVYVGLGLTVDQYKEITGEDYVASTPENTSATSTTSETTSTTPSSTQ